MFLMYFISELKTRNPLLFWYGLLNFGAAVVCLYLWQNTDVLVNGINAYIKPLKFFISIGIFCWTVGWLFHYLEMPRKVNAYNIMAAIVFTFESFVITWQAANGRLSHFNTSSVLYSSLFSAMGVAIVVLTIWTGYLGSYFFRKRNWNLSPGYLWGIRLGILFFVVFAFEGGIMASMLRHTVGAEDGGEGLPIVNWSRQHGDLRVAHFLGMHTLQLFPLFGYYLSKNKSSMIAFAAVYLTLTITIFVRALSGLPLF